MRRVLCCSALAIAAAGFTLSMTGTAFAQTEEKRVVIDSAPYKVAYRGGGAVTGHLEGWVAGDEVSLQRRDGDSFRTVSTKPVDDQGRVSFLLSGMRRTGVFRLSHVDPGTAAEIVSETRKVRVKAKVTLRLSTDHVMTGRTVTASGRISPGPGRFVKIQQRINGTWRTLGTAYEKEGRYAFRFEAKRVGHRRVRALFTGDERNVRAKDGTGLKVYDPALATWYGPGLYGNRTACGQTLKGGTLGVAHRTLPCGTKIAVLYGGRTIQVPVIDRGPYSRADWDLTQETAERLGFSGTDTIGVHKVRS